MEKPWSAAFAAALRRAHPEDSDPMRHYQPVWYGGHSWSGGDFGSAVGATVAGATSRAGQRGAGVVRLLRLFGRRRRLGGGGGGGGGGGW